MPNPVTELISKIVNRGTETVVPGKKELQELLESGRKLSIYLGIDPTATRIHLGHAVPLRKLQYFADLGHTVYFLIGDFTALIGDTSDKNAERPVLTPQEIEQNFQTYKEQASKIVDFSKITVVHNSDWLKKLGFTELLQLMRVFSVNDFISRELIRDRLDKGGRIGLAEVLYPIMQGYDSFNLDTDVQLGGTDQIFNMQAGRTMLKQLKDKESIVLTNGFLVGTDGRKMSKSWGNAIWLDDSPEEMFGKIMSLKDELILNYFALATSLSDTAIGEIETRIKSGEHPMRLKKELAQQIITELHGEKFVAAAEAFFVAAVQTKTAPEDTLVVKIGAAELRSESLITLLVEQNLCASKSDARRLLEQGGVYIDDQRVEVGMSIALPTTGEIVLRAGKRKYLRLEQ